ncbi:MAG: PadR family transcriptional regulator [Candidatus Baldrarchaeia archaeon]
MRLLQEGPKYGYELREEIKKRFNFTPGKVTSYAVLYSLRREGLVEVQEIKGSGEVARKYYVITEKGQNAMKQAKIFLKKLLDLVFDLTSDT